VIRAGGSFFLVLVGSVYRGEPDAVGALRAVFRSAAETLEETGYTDACPIATIALEVASTNERLREATAEAFDTWIRALTVSLRGGGCPPERAAQLATATIAALEGAFVLSRAQRNTAPMFAAQTMVEHSLLEALHATSEPPA
jgi:hypothetical protein